MNIEQRLERKADINKRETSSPRLWRSGVLLAFVVANDEKAECASIG